MSMSNLHAARAAGPTVPRLAAFQRVVPADVWTALIGILDVSPVTEAAPVIRHGRELRTEYRSRLKASLLTRHDHPGLEQIVHSLDKMQENAELHVRNLRTDAGRIVLVSDRDDAPIGAVALRRRAA